ncbi:MAG: TlpA disulfide reductase family protein [Leeuwenhoekiella sp.]
MKEAYKFFLLGCLISVLTLCESCADQKPQPKLLEKDHLVGEGEVKIPVYNFEKFQPILSFDDDYVHVINFWATWCKPCVKELPYFVAVSNEFRNEQIAMHYVSLDFSDQINERLIPFLKDYTITDDVLVLDDPKANDWIPKVNNEWSGAIPATYIYKGENTWFHEGSLTKEQLKTAVESFF